MHALSLLLPLTILALFLGGLLWAVRKWGKLAVKGVGDALDFSVVGRLALSPRQNIVLLRVGARVLIVSSGDGGVRTLGEVDSATELEALIGLDDSRKHRVRAVKESFEQALRKFRVPAAKTLPVVAALVTAALLGLAAPHAAFAQAPQFDVNVGGGGGAPLHISGPVGTVLAMGLLSMLPMLLLLMTSFTRVFIVLHFLKQALGTQTAPPNQLLSALALILTGFIMQPTLQKANDTALQPYLRGQMAQGDAYKAAIVPFRDFMIRQTKPSDLKTFITMSHMKEPKTMAEVPTTVVMSAFVTSELKTAFWLGFVIYCPFLIIDFVVGSVLMSLGMVMLPPVLVALPFKLLLFVLADGWVLLVQGLVASFH